MGRSRNNRGRDLLYRASLGGPYGFSRRASRFARALLRPPLMRTFGFAVICVWLFLPGWFAHAASAPPALQAEMNLLALRPRSGAPTWVEVKLTPGGGGLLEGALEIELSDDDTLLYRYRIPDVAMVGSAQSYRLLLP